MLLQVHNSTNNCTQLLALQCTVSIIVYNWKYNIPRDPAKCFMVATPVHQNKCFQFIWIIMRLPQCVMKDRPARTRPTFRVPVTALLDDRRVHWVRSEYWNEAGQQTITRTGHKITRDLKGLFTVARDSIMRRALSSSCIACQQAVSATKLTDASYSTTDRLKPLRQLSAAS